MIYQAVWWFVFHTPAPAAEWVTQTSPSSGEEFSELFSEFAALLPQNAAKIFFTPEALLSTFVPFLLMLLLEPLLLHFWGTTPGKFLFGMKLRSSEGEKLSLSDAFFRTWGVLFWGLGLDVPYFGFWRLWHSYSVVMDRHDRNRWEYVRSTGQPEQYLILEGRRYCIPFVVVCLLSYLGNLLQGGLFSYMPPNRYTDFPHRNLLSEEEFAENYQFYLDRYYSEYLDALEEYPGVWTADYTNPNTGRVESYHENEAGEWEMTLTMDATAPGAFQYTLRAPASHFQDRYAYGYPETYEMATTAGLLAYAGAMPGESFATFRPYKMMNTLRDQELNFNLTFQMSAEGTMGKWYKVGEGMTVPVMDNRVHVSQQVTRESTGEPVYSLYGMDEDEWLVLTFTVSNKIIRE